MTGPIAAEQRLDRSGIPELIKLSRAGFYTLPSSLTDLFEAYERLATATPPASGSVLAGTRDVAALMVDAATKGQEIPTADLAAHRADEQADADWRRAHHAALEQLADRVIQVINYGAATAVIVEYLQPAFVSALKGFLGDVGLLGGYATLLHPDNRLLVESEKIRQAYIRAYHFPNVYGSIRAGWEILRRDGRDHFCTDPLGAASMLGEVADIARVVPDWNQRGNGRILVTGPWPGGAAMHCRLAWFVQNNAELWIPTAAQQSAAYDEWVAATAPPRPRVIGGRLVPATAA